MNQFFKRYRDLLIPIIILIGLTFLLFFDSVDLANKHEDTALTFKSFSLGLDNYRSLYVAWRGRIFSNYLASLFVDYGEILFTKTNLFGLIETPLELSVALWTSGWFVIIAFPLIIVARSRSIFYLFGFFSAISFGYIARSTSAYRIYPWDMPAIFFYSLFLIFYLKKQYTKILFLIPLAMGFKETALVLSLSFLFIDEPFKKRLQLITTSTFLAIITKVVIDIFVQAPIPLLTMEANYGGDRFIVGNIHHLLDLHPLLINAGTLLALFLLPNYDKVMVGLKIVSLFFIINIFLFGVITEYRIFFELIPFSLYGLERLAYGVSSLQKANQPTLQKTN